MAERGFGRPDSDTFDIETGRRPSLAHDDRGLASPPRHHAQPHKTIVGDDLTRITYRCIYCGQLVQRRGLLRRWAHVR